MARPTMAQFAKMFPLGRYPALVLGLFVSVLPLLATAAEEGALEAALPLYMRRPSLEDTLLATRSACAAALAKQKVARAAVTLEPWFLATTVPLQETLEQASVDLDRSAGDGKPSWLERSDWQDGSLFDFPGSTAFLCRQIIAKRPVTLLIGIGGGDRLEVYLNGKKVLLAETAIPYGRYGTRRRLDGSRVDQVVQPLPLVSGENQILVKVHQESDGPTQAFFSTTPDPVPFLWRQIEKEFPRSLNRLLAEVRSDWFRTEGWFASSDSRFERRLLGRIVNDVGVRGGLLKERWEALEKQNVRAADRRWLELCVTAAELYTALRSLDRLRLSVSSLAEEFAGEYPGEAFLRRLLELEGRLIDKTADGLDPSEEASRRLTRELDRSRREMLVAENPLLKGEKVLFIRRYTYDSPHFYDDYYQGLRKYGGGISLLSVDDGAVKEVLPQLSGGIFDRFDLSFDARRIVFGYRPPRAEGFRIWEAAVDGSGLRQLSFEPEDEAERMARYSLYSGSVLRDGPGLHGHWTDDMHPAYLPNGQIVFASSRSERTAVCGGHSLPCAVLYKIDADGANMERLSQGMLTEATPAVLEDGRVFYTRWEYVFKGIAAVQSLWAMFPDGTGSREVYGNNIRDPGVFYQARQVPGHPNLIVCNGCGHEPLSVGTIVLLDLLKDKRTEAVMTSLTPDTEVRGLRGLYQRRNGEWRADDVYGPFYCDPYPLSDKYFLVSANPDKRYNDESAYGIYLLDVFGNRVPVYDDPEMSCFVPTLLKPRRKPPSLVPCSSPGAVAKGPGQSPSNRSAEGEATLLLLDVHEGLPGVERGSVKYLRVLKQIPRPWSVWPCAGDDSVPGQMVAVSWFSHIWISVLEGIVPVHEDGSAYFRVPADTNIYFQALDENFMEIQRMRTFVNFRPGEQRSCIGCHEDRSRVPSHQSGGQALALRQPPVKPGPQPGDVAPRPLHYETDVQPILDKHCVSCHGDEEAQGDLVLTGELTAHFNRSYEELMSKELVKTVREWSSPRGQRQVRYWPMEHAPTVAPYAYGSHASPLIDLLRKGHYDVKLSRPEFVKLVTWVDSNGQYYGSYFGYRNERYKGLKDFRPHPSLDSACGVRPETARPERLEAVPAQLVARWSFDEAGGETAYDSSGNDYHGDVVGARWVRGKEGGGLSFSGTAEFVRVRDMPGTFDTMSIAFWIRADSHRNSWNPVLYCDDWSEKDIHLGLLSSARVNLAIHDGSGGFRRASDGSVGDGEWHHVAVVCDGRAGGFVQFYIDGKPERSHPHHGIGMPIELRGVRLGAYNKWEKNAGRNFHGALDDFRVYRGMLSAERVAELAFSSDEHPLK